MAEFGVEATGLSEPSAKAAKFIRSPVEDRTTAEAVTAVGGLAVELGRGKVLADLEGELNAAQEAEADPELIEAMKSGTGIKDEAVNDLSKLAQAVRSGMPRDRARVLAANIVRKAKSTTLGSLFASDIDAAANQFLGARAGAAGGFLGPTPQERAREEFVEKRELAVLNTLQFTGTREEAEATVDAVAQSDAQAQLARNTASIRALNSTELANATQDMAYTSVMRLQGEILDATQAGGGALSIEQQQFFRNKIALVEPELRKGILSLQAETGTADVAAANTIVTNALSPLATMINDNSALQIMTDKSTLLDKNLDVIMHKHFGEIIALNKLGPDMVRIYSEMARNPGIRAAYAKDPIMNTLISKTGDLQRDWAKVVSGGMASLVNPNRKASPDDIGGQAALIGSQGGEKIYDAVEAEQATKALRNIASSIPNAIVALTEPRWQRTAAKNPEKWTPILQSTMSTLAGRAHLNATAETGGSIPDVQVAIGVVGSSGKVLEVGDTTFIGIPPRPVKVTEKMLKNQAAIQGTRAIVTSSTNIGEDARINVQTMYQMASSYPVLWQEDFANPTEYVQSLLGLTIIKDEE